MVASAGTQTVSPNEWLQRIEEGYLSDYVRSGGSAVKFVSGSDEALAAVAHGLGAMSSRLNYWFSRLDPEELDGSGKKPNLHLIDRFFLVVTREVDWKSWAAAEAKTYLESNGIRIEDGRELGDLEGIAADNGRDTRDLIRQFQTQFATPRIKDHTMTLEFRTALTDLSRAQIMPDPMNPTTEEVLLGWFKGEAVRGGAAALRRIHIFGRIDRSNARYMLASFCRWLRRTGRAGLVAVLDFRPYERMPMTRPARQKRANEQLRDAIASGAGNQELQAIIDEADVEPPLSYTPGAYLQMLQMLRRFIDETESFSGLCLVVLTTPSFYDQASARSYYNYDALQTRIGLEVHDARLSNPDASLVHLGELR